MSEDTNSGTVGDTAAGVESKNDSVSEPQLPSVTDTSKHEKTNNNRILVVAILIAVLLVLFFVTSSRKEGGIFSVVPVGASKVEALDVSPATFAYISSLPLWNESDKLKTVLQVGVFKKMLPGYVEREDYNALAALIKRIVVADIKGEKLYVMDSGNPWQIERSYSASLTENEQNSKVEVERIQKVYKLKIADSDFYLVKMSSRIVMSKSKDLIAAAIRCYRGDDTSLADLGVRWDDDSDQKIIGYQYQVPAAVNTDRLRELGFAVNDYRKDAAELTTILVSSGINNGIVTRMRVINNSDIRAASGGGILSFIGSAILIVLALVIGLPMAFLAIVMLTAVYFYLVALIKGELVPVEPPELPELSPQIKQDLAKKEAPLKKTGDNPSVDSDNKVDNSAE